MEAHIDLSGLGELPEKDPHAAKKLKSCSPSIWLRPVTFPKRSRIGSSATFMDGKAWTRSPGYTHCGVNVLSSNEDAHDAFALKRTPNRTPLNQKAP
tara:strand:- start:501 stop:791 length:291 start_codon:yes stop_codon:yes gene_type:complete